MKAAAVAIEAHASGALHMHALLLGRYIPQAWLSRQAKEVGLGRITHITALHPHANPSGIADYLAPGGTGRAAPIEKMTAAAYLTASKHGIGPVAARSGKRVRPLRFSRNWPTRPGKGGAMTKAEEDLIAFLFADQDEDDGPFEMWAESQLWDEMQAIRNRHNSRSALTVPW